MNFSKFSLCCLLASVSAQGQFPGQFPGQSLGQGWLNSWPDAPPPIPAPYPVPFPDPVPINRPVPIPHPYPAPVPAPFPVPEFVPMNRPVPMPFEVPVPHPIIVRECFGHKGKPRPCTCGKKGRNCRHKGCYGRMCSKCQVNGGCGATMQISNNPCGSSGCGQSKLISGCSGALTC